MRRLALSPAQHLEFVSYHSQVVRPLNFKHGELGFNPYHLGFEIWNAIRIYYDGMYDPALLDEDRQEKEWFEKLKDDFVERDVVPPDAGKKTGHQKIFEV